MPETLLHPSGVLLYGRLVTDLTLAPGRGGDYDKLVPERVGRNRFLQEQLNADDARLARIYAFSYEGHYYDLARPAIFLVHGDGTLAERMPTSPDARVARAPDTADRSGVATQDYSYSEDIYVWAYDKGDYSLRLDTTTGPLEQILVDAELAMAQPQAGRAGYNTGYNVGYNIRARGGRGE